MIIKKSGVSIPLFSPIGAGLITVYLVGWIFGVSIPLFSPIGAGLVDKFGFKLIEPYRLNPFVFSNRSRAAVGSAF